MMNDITVARYALKAERIDDRAQLLTELGGRDLIYHVRLAPSRVFAAQARNCTALSLSVRVTATQAAALIGPSCSMP